MGAHDTRANKSTLFLFLLIMKYRQNEIFEFLVQLIIPQAAPIVFISMHRTIDN